MYLSHFHLRESPFSIAPDPAYLYLSTRHQEALGHLLYGTGQHGGFVQLTGEVGTGKTTIVRTLLRQNLNDVEVAMVHNPRQSEAEFVASLCDEFNVDYPRTPAPSLKTLVDALNVHLLKAHGAGKRSVLIIDEAQNLAPEVLEQVRLLTNLETDKEKLLRIMLVGQPELAELLERRELRQLASRITARYHLLPLSETETREYIAHRLNVAGGAPTLFAPAALRAVYRRSRGVPRLINILCDRALLGAYAKDLHQVSSAVVQHAAAEVLGTPLPISVQDRLRRSLPHHAPRTPLAWVGAAVAGIVLVVAGVLLGRAFQPSADTATRHKVALSAAPDPAAAIGPVGTDGTDGIQPSARNNTAVDSVAVDNVAVASTTSTARTDANPTSAPVATAAAPATPTNLGRIIAHPESLGTLTGRLIALWDPQAKIPVGANVCAVLADDDLQCYHGTGDWADLREMNRPAILRLAIGNKSTQYILLRRLDADQATLATADGAARLPVAQLRPAWTGEFFLLWRGATGTNYVRPDAHGPAVVWLRRQLARVNGTPLANPPSPVFDNDLRTRVMDYQRAAGLDVDGLAGVMTLISLSTVGHLNDTPMLHSHTGAGG